jgi:glyoxylase-like metal-dependent hydrolase (beta-lactamase superfamily II)
MLQSIKEKILTLPDDTIIWPGHNYGGSPTSTVGLEKKRNPYVTDFDLA